jgi:hypothetical protein
MDDSAVAVTAAEGDPHGEGALRFWALKDGDCFVVCDPHGDITGGPDGLFDADTRLLSRLRLLIGDRRPTLLSSGVTSDNVVFTFHGANRPLPPSGGRVVPPGVLHVERRRLIWRRRLYEHVSLTNHGLDEILAPVSIEFAADFRDMFEVRGDVRARRGTPGEPRLDGRSATFDYEGLDGQRRTSVVAFSEPRISWPGSVPAGGSTCSSRWPRRPMKRRTSGASGRLPPMPGAPCGSRPGTARDRAPTAPASTAGSTSRGPTWRCWSPIFRPAATPLPASPGSRRRSAATGS